MSEQVVPASMKTKVVHEAPTLCLDSTDMPEVADYDVGQTYDAIVHCEMVSKRKGDDSPWGDNELPNITSGRFKVLSIKPLDSTSIKGNGKMKAIKKRLTY